MLLSKRLGSKLYSTSLVLHVMQVYLWMTLYSDFGLCRPFTCTYMTHYREGETPKCIIGPFLRDITENIVKEHICAWFTDDFYQIWQRNKWFDSICIGEINLYMWIVIFCFWDFWFKSYRTVCFGVYCSWLCPWLHYYTPAPF